MGQQQGKRRHTRSTGTGQRNKMPGRKKQSNDSPEIPNRGKTSDILGLPSGKGRLSAPLLLILTHSTHYSVNMNHRYEQKHAKNKLMHEHKHATRNQVAMKNSNSCGKMLEFC